MNLEKEYKIPIDLYREGYREYQKKYIYPKSYIFTAIFLILAANFIYGAVNAPNNYLAYLLIVICIAMAFREWFNPRKARDAVMETVREMGDPTFRLTVTDEVLEISTIDESDVENPAEESEDTEECGEEAPPEPTKIPIGKELSILEYDSFFLAVYGKAVFYIIPKENFSEPEMAVLREINK